MKTLEKREIPRCGFQTTFIGFGALEIGRDWGLGSQEERTRPDEDQAKAVLNRVLDLEINLIDTASAYHKSEERIGSSISSRRNEFILASKCGEHNDEPHTYYDFSYKAVKESIDESLRKLKTDVIDIMQIHFGPDPEKVMRDGETVAAMKDAQKEGKIRYLGASIDGDLARECIESGDFDVMQMNYSLLNQVNDENIKLCREKGIGVFIRGGFAMGKLTPRVIPNLKEDFREKARLIKMLDLLDQDADRLADAALQFLYENRGISSVLIGTKTINHLEENLHRLEQPIDQAILDQLIKIGKEQ